MTKYSFVFLCLFPLLLGAQNKQIDRIERDIEVAEEIIASLLSEPMRGSNPSIYIVGRGSRVEGTYLDGFGVLFTISSEGFFSRFNSTQKRSGDLEDSQIFLYRNDTIIEQVVRGGTFKGKMVNTDSANSENHFKSLVNTFVTDYAYLLRNIPANEKIMFRNVGKNNWVFQSNGQEYKYKTFSRSTSDSSVSATITMEKVNQYTKESISKEVLLKSISYQFEEQNAKQQKDLEVLAGILSRLYQSDLSTSFRLKQKPSYEEIDGVGAILYLNMSSHYDNDYVESYLKAKELLGIIDNGKDESEKKRLYGLGLKSYDSNKMDSLYQIFIEEFKTNVLEYGTVVKELSEDEALIFKVSLGKCTPCKIKPESIEVTVRKSTLTKFRKGQISLEKGIQEIQVKSS